MNNAEKVQPQAGIIGGQRLRLKQLLVEVIDQLTDQLIQVEQQIAQGLPDLAAGLGSARDMREIESLLEETAGSLAACGPGPAKQAFLAAAGLSWKEERSWSQSREQALEKGITSLLQAAWLGTMLKQQAILTERLTAARRLFDDEEAGADEILH